MSGSTNDIIGMRSRFVLGGGTRGVFAVIIHGDRLLISQWRDQATWNLAGGGVNPGETDEEALRREVRDETGLEVMVHCPIGGERVKNDDTIQLYLCTITGGALVATRESREHRWVTPDDIGSVPWAGGGLTSRHARMAWDGLSLLREPVLITRSNWPVTGIIETGPEGLFFQLPNGACLRWEVLSVR